MSTAPVAFTADSASASDQLARARILMHLALCPVCGHYLKRRGDLLLVAVAGRATMRQVSFPVLLNRYLQKVHARHLAGGSLSTRPSTPPRLIGRTTTITVQRACNGCGKQLGDATLTELEADRLPDVRLECGCWTEGVAA